MRDYLKTYGTTLGPIDVPMTDDQAFNLDSILKSLPESDRQLHKAKNPLAMLSLEAGERADLSWITTEAIDRDREIVLAAGMNDTHFQLNPLVTLGHCYYMPPVGRSLWRQPGKEKGLSGVIAKTHYPPKPEGWQDAWSPDEIFMLMQAGLMNGKSIGFIALKRHQPTDKEIEKRPELVKVRSIVDEWLLIEYACCPIPVNPATVTMSVSKSVREAMGWPDAPAPKPEPPVLDNIPFITLAEVECAIIERVNSYGLTINPAATAQQVLDRHRGRV